MDENKKEIFNKLLDESFKKRKSIEPGAQYTAIVTSRKDDYIFIRTETGSISGIIPSGEFNSQTLPQVNDTLTVHFVKENYGDYYFTHTMAAEEADWTMMLLAYEKEIPVLGQIKAEINGGYEVKVGEFTGFCPHSQLDSEAKQKNPVGSEYRFIIHEANQKTNKLVLSQKRISDKEKEYKREILKEELKVGHFATCVVKSIHNFGMIVDLSGMDALIPASEASFRRNTDLEKEFQIGQTLRGKVLSLNWEDNKISLSIKDSLQDPWASNVPFKEGDVVEATIDSIKTFGAFVKLDDDFTALVPNKESGFPARTPLNNHLHKGDKIDVFIMEVNPQKRQIAASISRAKQAKEKMEYQKYLSDQEEVQNTSSFGLLLKKSLQKK